MKDFAGTPGTVTALILRMLQCFFAAGSIASMATTSTFFEFTAFWYFLISHIFVMLYYYVSALRTRKGLFTYLQVFFFLLFRVQVLVRHSYLFISILRRVQPKIILALKPDTNYQLPYANHQFLNRMVVMSSIHLFRFWSFIF